MDFFMLEKKKQRGNLTVLQVLDKKMQRRWRQNLLGCTQRKDKRQRMQTVTSEIPLR